MAIFIGPKLGMLLAKFTWWLMRVRGKPMPNRTGPLEIGELCRMPGGDGDQAFFSEVELMRLTEADWFPGRVLLGEALLFVVAGGKFDGQHVALTTRTLAPLRKQLVDYGSASVVVHLIHNPTLSFDGGDEDAFAIGMSVVMRV